MTYHLKSKNNLYFLPINNNNNNNNNNTWINDNVKFIYIDSELNLNL